MREEHHMGVNLDVCPQCSGVWFDYDEVNRYLEAHSEVKAPASGEDAETLLIRTDEETGEECPKCRHFSIESGEAQGIRFRRCTLFCGFFLELEDFRKLAGFRLPTPTPATKSGAFGRAMKETTGRVVAEGIAHAFMYLVGSVLDP
jgi:Zn-finger nucleic acid-binding protein